MDNERWSEQKVDEKNAAANSNVPKRAALHDSGPGTTLSRNVVGLHFWLRAPSVTDDKDNDNKSNDKDNKRRAVPKDVD
jgi:hypothetical protein